MSDAPLSPRKEELDGTTSDGALAEEELAAESDPEAASYVETVDPVGDPTDPSVDEAYAVDDDDPVEDPIEPVELVEPAPPVSARSDQPVMLLTSDEPATAVVEPEVHPDVVPVGVPAASATDSRVVYVENPVPPRTKHNRVFGALMALLSTVIFAALYFGIVVLLVIIQRAGVVTGLTLTDFLGQSLFFIPVIFFAVFSVLLALLVNRAGWAAHVIGSLFVALLVYVASLGTLLLLDGVVSMTAATAARELALALANPYLVAAAIAAREVSMWFGLGIAARGRRVTAKNVSARETFDREQAERRAEHERAYAPTV